MPRLLFCTVFAIGGCHGHVDAALVVHDVRDIGEVDIDQIALDSDDFRDAFCRRCQNVIGFAERIA